MAGLLFHDGARLELDGDRVELDGAHAGASCSGNRITIRGEEILQAINEPERGRLLTMLHEGETGRCVVRLNGGNDGEGDEHGDEKGGDLGHGVSPEIVVAFPSRLMFIL